MKRRGSYLTGGIGASLGPPPAKNSRSAETGENRSLPKPKDLDLPSSSSLDRSVSETEAGLIYLRSLFPVECFEPRLPPIVMKHQMYSLVQDRTAADRELMSLCDSGRVRLLKLGEASDDYAVVFTGDYLAHVRTHLGDTPLCRKFTSTIVPGCREVSVTRRRMSVDLRVTDEEIATLVNRGVLLVRDVGKACSWWFAIPGISPFIKQYSKGRAMVQQMIKRSKYGEILQKDLQERKLTVSRLGMEYHIHDIVGAELVECVETTSGPLLRLNKTTQRH